MSAMIQNRFLKPEVLARLGSLELVAKTVVDGVLTGLHRSPDFGFSQEFAEYRAYNEGDDLRFVDWNVYARADRMYIKRFRGETNTAVTVLLDASASMGFGDPVSKIDQARFLVASLAYLARKQHDAVGLTVFDEGVRHHMLPESRPDTMTKTMGFLANSDAGSGTDIIHALSSISVNMSRRGLLILVSDMYAEPEDIVSALQPLVHGGQDIALFHVLDDAELSPTISQISLLNDLESNDSVVVDPAFLQSGYKQAFEDHCQAIQQNCVRVGADYVRVLTSEPLDNAIAGYLQFRERHSR